MIYINITSDGLKIFCLNTPQPRVKIFLNLTNFDQSIFVLEIDLSHMITVQLWYSKNNIHWYIVFKLQVITLNSI